MRRREDADDWQVHLPRLTGAALGTGALVMQLPLLLTLFVLRDSVDVVTALALAFFSPYPGIAGVVLSLRARSRFGVVVSALSLGGMALVMLVLYGLALALGQG